jgi:purine catabolism regulator
MPLTLREVLGLDVVQRGSPLVVAGAARLDVPVRWVHAAELTDIGRLLRGGELVLSTGIVLPESAAELTAYVDSLAEVGVAGLPVRGGAARRAGGRGRGPVRAADRATARGGVH